MHELAGEKQRILIVDDEPDLGVLIGDSLTAEGYLVKSVTSAESVIYDLKNWKPHVMLLDINMPRMNGYEVLELIRKNREYIPVIFISGSSYIEKVIQGLDEGADDYICKPFDMGELCARVRCQLRIKELRDQLKSSNERLAELLDIDDLTGLYNMRSMYKRLELEIKKAAKNNVNLCIYMMDMDKFKSVNKACDHLFGSFVLSKVGRIIKELLRENDLSARFGGDEYLIVTSDVDASGAQIFAKKLLNKISKHTFKNDMHFKRVTASIGCVLLEPSVKHITPEQIIRKADDLLYEAKEAGRDRFKYELYS